MQKYKHSFFIKNTYKFFIIFALSIHFNLFSKNINYKKLKEEEKKLQYNESTYKELLKAEKELRKDINEVNKNIKKYKKLIDRGFSDQEFLKSLVLINDKKLKKIKLEQSVFKKNQSLILNNFLFHEYNNNQSMLINELINNILKSTELKKNKNEVIQTKLKKEIEKNNSSIEKLEKTLSNINFSLNSRSVKMEGLIGENIITKIEKRENIIQKSKIKKKVNEIRTLIEKFENNSNSKKSFGSFKFSSLKDILPINKQNIIKINIDKLKTGILLSIKNDTILKAPKDSLVVYADFFKGYGKMIILDLGNNYHLIFSGISLIFCKTGDWLEKGSIIGNIDINNNKLVYMEIRFKGKTVNPSKWAKL
ncbi:MAG: hypothetical protein CBE14_001455 [Rickettsiales bacterium TMED254]|nr:hypothetical protein [Rickettsiales bacterium]RPF77149.1 MAG: hypothetical protein CBE14_001455 [Rickettsiales bacterium TMED254]|tara:strand:- start:659 stop:1753 length:1095 start_codon:yes stop_codon:yes gene_type:complete